MKTPSRAFVALIATAVFISCSLLEPPLPLGYPRPRRQGGFVQDAGNLPWASGRDSALYVSAACFPESYDWRRDSAFGAVACTVKLYRGIRPVLSIPAGPSERISVSPDRHHILGGALFTDYDDSRGTTVKRNGTTVGEWKDAEIIRGLLYKDGVLHTLGVSRSGGVLTYRRNGLAVLKLDRGEPLGGFSADTYGPSGCLYEDGGHVCFAYKTVTEGMNAVYVVSDGVPELLLSSPDIEILDAKILGGVPTVLYNQAGVSLLSAGRDHSNVGHSGGLFWLSAGVLTFEERPSVAGRYRATRTGKEGYGLGWADVTYLMNIKTSYIYCDGTSWRSLVNPVPGYEDCYFFHRHCACLTAGGLAMALTPKDTARRPFLVRGEDTYEYKIHGYLSGIGLTITE